MMLQGETIHGGTFNVNPPCSVSAHDKNSSYVDNYSQSFKTDFIRATLQRYKIEGDFLSVDAYSCDNFRMYEFKVRKCTSERSHDWTDCPFAHPGEKARRRDPKKFHYSGTACPDFRRGRCSKGDGCDFAHGIFECWLHPARYRTQPCKDGMNCTRRVCFFAHAPDQLRVLSPHAEPTPVPPVTSNSVNEMVASMRRLQLIKMNSMPNFRGGGGSGGSSPSPPGFFSQPTTPTRPVTRVCNFDVWDSSTAGSEEEPVMERVESGRDLRAKMFEKLSKENPLDRVDPEFDPNLDMGWVSNLVMM